MGIFDILLSALLVSGLAGAILSIIKGKKSSTVCEGNCAYCTQSRCKKNSW